MGHPNGNAVTYAIYGPFGARTGANGYDRDDD